VEKHPGSSGSALSAPRISGFYLHGVAGSQWVVGASDPNDNGNPFWLAIDPFGDGARYLVTVEQASIGTLARRPTASHPGLLERAVTLGIRVKRRDYRIFESIGP
jgi:hypothetical protein